MTLETYVGIYVGSALEGGQATYSLRKCCFAAVDWEVAPDEIQTGGKASRDPAWMKRYGRSTLAGSVILARVLP